MRSAWMGVAIAALVLGSGTGRAQSGAASAPAPHPVTLDDLMDLARLGDLACSTDGRWAAYTVGIVDAKADKRHTAIWLADLAGGAPRRLTSADDSASAPRFSPDGRSIAFLATRGKDEADQVWLLDRQGGEPVRLTEVKGEITDYRWSPDSKSLLLTMTDPAPEPPAEDPKRPLPKVIDEIHFKQDTIGFLTAESHSHLYRFDMATHALTRLTAAGPWDEGEAEWSPDGKTIAFIANHRTDPAAPATQWLETVDAFATSTAHVVARFADSYGQKLAWSADGKRITHAVGLTAPRVNEYSQPHLAETDLATGATRILPGAAALALADPVALGKGRIGAILSEDRHQFAVALDAAGGPIERLGDGIHGVDEQCGGSGGKGPRAALVSGDGLPPELAVLDGPRVRVVSDHNAALAKRVAWAPLEDFAARASDGNDVHGLLLRPAGYVPGKRYPTVLWIHGGPTAQDDHRLEVSGDGAIRQWLAAKGYAVLAVNYRGSSGRGDDYASTIAGDWGNKEVKDLEAALDWAVAQGIADPDRLAVGGWSYGGILTDFLIVRDPRLKAAVSGAGEGNIFALFGVDQYIKQYMFEIGAPWKDLKPWLQMSEPLLHADRIKTPTLFMGGTSDDNVPLVGGQQMYEALRINGVPTQLVAYPGAFHGFRRPSFVRDRYQRIADWYDRYLLEKRN